MVRASAAGGRLSLDEIEPAVTVKLQFRGRHLVGPRGAGLLRGIRETGSLVAAARAVGLSYKSAWSYLDEMRASLGVRIVVSSRGGARGGGRTDLTPAGTAVLGAYERLEARARRIAGPGVREAAPRRGIRPIAALD